MKRILLIFSLFLVGFLSVTYYAHAQTPAFPPGQWVLDSEVTFVGKTAARAGAFLDWTLENYNWVQLGTNAANPLIPFWIIIRNIVYAIFALFILSTAFLMIITRGRNISFRKFVPRFMGILLLVTFSFGLVQIIYQITDIIQGFFLRNPDQATQSVHAIISQQNLLNVAFNYQDFVGYRLTGSAGDESAVITLLLTKITAVTYYAMSSMLIIRKIVMWFFIVISPIFPLLLFYPPIRNTAKIWVGEFFRWTLYGPLFAILLAGLVSIWSTTIPLFAYKPDGNLVTKTTQAVYPTAVNILLGGPKQAIGIANSVNLPETFALYMICLMMLWAVLILPFILLRIFLDYLFSLSLSEGVGAKQFIALTNTLLNRNPSPVPAPLPSFPTGLAKALPFGKKLTIPEQAPARVSTSFSATKTVAKPTQIQEKAPITTDLSRTSQVLHLMNLSVPTMQDIARLETTHTSQQSQTSISSSMQNLALLANPQLANTPQERQQYEHLRDRLQTESRKGNILAKNVLSAATTTVTTSVTTQDDTKVLVTILNNIAAPQVLAQGADRVTYETLRETVKEKTQAGNPLASLITQFMTTKAPKASPAQKTLTTTVNNLIHPEQVTSEKEKETIQILTEQITKEAVLGTPLAKELLSFLNGSQPVTEERISQMMTQLTVNKTEQSVVSYLNSTTQGEVTPEIVATFIQSLAQPDLLPQEQKKVMQSIRETIVTQSSPLATALLPVIQSPQNITKELIDQVTQTLKQVRGQVTIQTLLLKTLQAPEEQAPASSAATIQSLLEKLLNKEHLTDPKEKEMIQTLLGQIQEQSERGDILAKSILDVTTGVTTPTKETLLNITQQIRLEEEKGSPLITSLHAALSQKEVKVEDIKEKIVTEKANGDDLASLLYSILSKQRQRMPQVQNVKAEPTLPQVNRIQSVSIEDYEAVKKIWKENYKQLDEPIRSGVKVNKGVYIQQDIDDITMAINLLSSPMQDKKEEGMKKVSGILPFLLIGGFSQTEIIGYLKAKMEAAKDVLEGVSEKEEDEETKVEARRTTDTNVNHLQAEAEIPLDK